MRWWRAIPLGAVERLLALVEVATVICLAAWTMRAGQRASAPAGPPLPVPED